MAAEPVVWGWLFQVTLFSDQLPLSRIAWRVRPFFHEAEYSRRVADSTTQPAGTALGSGNPLVFLPSHRSNLDRLSLQYMLWENDFPPNHTAGGINLNFFPVGPLIRRTGVFFIRRSFKDNELYKHVLKSYLGYLVEKRFPLEWYMEGGRSRSGKLLPPRLGLRVRDRWLLLGEIAAELGRGHCASPRFMALILFSASSDRRAASMVCFSASRLMV